MFLTDNVATCFMTFFWSFFLAWILAMTQLLSPWWILFLGASVLFFHKNGYDFGGANVFLRWFGGMFGRDNACCIQTFLFTWLLQFLGAFCGAIVYNLIMDVAVVPATSDSLEDGKLFILFAFANFFQAYAVQRSDDVYQTAAMYAVSWVLCNVTWAGSIGGITIDFGRLLAGELTHGDTVDFDKFWLLIVSPLAGWGVCFLYQILEMAMDKKGGANGDDKKDAEPASSAADEQA